MRKIIVFWLILTFSLTNCGSSNPLSKNFASLLIFFGFFKKSSIASITKVNLPNDFPKEALSIKIIDSNAKPVKNSGLVSISDIYDLKIKANLVQENNNLFLPDPGVIETQEFNDQKVEIEFSYDEEKLFQQKLNEEFSVLYFNPYSQNWEALREVSIDFENNRVIALTTHFTEFILTAVPKQDSSNIASIPACLQSDLATINLQGINANAKFTIVGKGFQYYQDRAYEIKQFAGDFEDLGFEGSLAIATCQGDTPSAGTNYCGTSAQHKYNNTSNYISFTAHTDIDVYIMYDSRGPADGSKNASWLAEFDNLGKRIYTTDVGLDPDLVPGANGYKVYRKTYTAGSNIVLGGDWEGFPSNSVGHPIQSNYWVIIKNANTLGIESRASQLCVTNPPTLLTKPPKLIHSFSGSFERNFLNNPVYQNTIIWENPRDPEPYRIIIRRSTSNFPSSLMEGDSPTGTSPNDQAYIDRNLVIGTTYYYSIFAVDENLNYDGFATTTITVRPDTDEDGISDFDEGLTNLDFLFSRRNSLVTFPNPAISDSDQDGIADGLELAAGTDPTDSDIIKPNITSFNVTPNIGYLNYLLRADYKDSDNIQVTSWYIGKEIRTPLSYNSYWEMDPIKYYKTPHGLNGNLTLWVKDAAGNVTASDSVAYISNPNTVKPEYVVFGCQPKCESTTGNFSGLSIYKINTDESLTYSNKISISTTSSNNTFVLTDSVNSNIFLIEKEANKISRYSFNRTNNALSKITELTLGTDIKSACTMLDAKLSPTSIYLIIAARCSNLGIPGIVSFAFIYSLSGESIEYVRSVPTVGGSKAVYSILFGNYDTDVFLNIRENVNSVINSYTELWTLRLTDGSLVKNSLILPYPDTSTFNVSGNISWQNMNFSNLENFFLTSICGAESLCTDSSSQAKLRRYTIDYSTYQLIDKKDYESPSTILASASDPNSSFFFLLSRHNDNKVYLDTIKYSSYLTNFSFLNSIPAFNFLFLKYDQASGIILLTNNSNEVSIFNYLDPNSGGILLKNSSINSNNINSIDFIYSSIPNLAPRPNIIYKPIVELNSYVALNSFDSFDPDAIKCGTQNLPLLRSWQIISKPSGSTANLSSSNGIVTGFIADQIGLYRIRLTLVDNPGSCATISESATRDIQVRVAYKKTADFQYLSALPSAPNDAISGLTFKIDIDPNTSLYRSVGTFRRSYFIGAYRSADAGNDIQDNEYITLAGFGEINVCSRDQVTRPDGKKYCDQVAPYTIYYQGGTAPILVVTHDYWNFTNQEIVLYSGRITYWSNVN